MAIPKSQDEDQDRLSQLPDSILLHIFSFLTTYEVIHNLGSVSKHLSSLIKTSFHSLVFKESDLKLVNYQRSIGFIDNYFIFNNKNFEKFCIEALTHFYLTKLDIWIRAAINRNVKILELLLPNNHYCLPKFLFRDGVFLTRLKLRRVRIKDYGEVFECNSLKSLSITHTTLDNAMLEKLLSCSPMLECFGLVHCSGIKKLEIVSTTLKELKLRNCTNNLVTIGDIMRVSAPSLQILDISGYLYYKEFMIENCSSLVEANLNFRRFRKHYIEQNIRNDESIKNFEYWWSERLGQYVDEPDPRMDVKDELEYNQQITMAREFIGSVQHVTKLSLGNWSIRVLSMQTLPCIFSRCKHVTLAINFMQWELAGVARVLENCPELESLTLDMRTTWSTGCNDITNDHKGKNFWVSNPSYGHFNCLQQHLKMVKIIGVAPHKGGVLVTEFLQFLMKHARVLERLSIQIDSKLDDKHKSDKHTILKLSVFHMLSSFPRSSPVAVIEVTSNDSTKSCTSKIIKV